MTLDEQLKTIEENTFGYINKYLDPARIWKNDVPPQQRIVEIKQAKVNWSAVAIHIQDMSYQKFLKTPYWKAIAAHVKYKAGYRCQICNSARNLSTHHRNYEIHGFEHAYMQELTVLCQDCHDRFHDRLRKPKGKTKKNPFSRHNFKSFFSSPLLSLPPISLLLFLSFACRLTEPNASKPVSNDLKSIQMVARQTVSDFNGAKGAGKLSKETSLPNPIRKTVPEGPKTTQPHELPLDKSGPSCRLRKCRHNLHMRKIRLDS